MRAALSGRGAMLASGLGISQCAPLSVVCNYSSRNWRPNASLLFPSGTHLVVITGQTVSIRDLFPFTPLAPSQKRRLLYQLYVYGSASLGYIAVNGVQQPTNVWLPDLSGANLDAAVFVASSNVYDSNHIAVVAFNGATFSAQYSMYVDTMKHAVNTPPRVTVSNVNVGVGQAVDIRTLFPATDDEGDPIVQYLLWDYGTGGGYIRVNGVQQASGQWITVQGADLANTQYVGGPIPGSETVAVRVSDGMTLSQQQNVTVNTV